MTNEPKEKAGLFQVYLSVNHLSGNHSGYLSAIEVAPEILACSARILLPIDQPQAVSLGEKTLTTLRLCDHKVFFALNYVRHAADIPIFDCAYMTAKETARLLNYLRDRCLAPTDSTTYDAIIVDKWFEAHDLTAKDLIEARDRSEERTGT